MFRLTFILLLLEYTVADLVAPRAFQGCVLNMKEIHCYGGYTSPSTGNLYTNATNDHFYLAADTLNFTALPQAEQRWQPIDRPPNLRTLPYLGGMSVASIAMQTQFVVYGGFTEPNNQTLSTTTWKCSTSTNNSWSPFPSQGFYATYSPIIDLGGSRLWSWGGLENNTNTATKNLVYTLDYFSNKWYSKPGDTANGNIWIKHAAALSQNDSRIYMMGGYEMEPGSTNTKVNQMTLVRWFDTTANTWGTDQATVSNNQPITSRVFHTTTYVPSSSKLLIYGGYNEQEAKICQDYVYVYDILAKQYTPLDLNDKGPGPRAAHSAVTYESYIMIMFGFDADMKLQQDFNGLDVSDVNHITWSSSTPATNHTNNSSDDNPGDGRLSLGGTIGVAIAAAAVFIGIVAAIIYFFYRKKQQRQQFQLEKMDPRGTNVSGSSLDALNAYPYLQKPDDEEFDSNATQKASDGPRSSQSDQTRVGPYGTPPLKDSLLVKPTTDTDEHNNITFPHIQPHSLSYELADRNDSHHSIKPHDAHI